MVEVRWVWRVGAVGDGMLTELEAGANEELAELADACRELLARLESTIAVERATDGD